MSTRYRVARCSCADCQAAPTLAEIEWVLREMDRHGVNRGWVLAGALRRAQRGERQPVAVPVRVECPDCDASLMTDGRHPIVIRHGGDGSHICEPQQVAERGGE